MKSNISDLIISIILGLIIWNVYKNYTAPRNNKYLTFWPRFWAPAIDEIVLWLPTSLVPYIIYRIFALESNSINILYASENIIYFLYSIYFHGSYGATVGKMATKVKVVDAITEEPITFKKAFIRDSIPLILSIVIVIYIPLSEEGISNADIKSHIFLHFIVWFWFLAEVITMLTNDKRRALHDYIAGTVVIRTNIKEH
jgi:uncharacterized RDD family membrane protein YckC